MAMGPFRMTDGDAGNIPGLPIADYAMLSDCQSAALVSGAGSVDWLCFPRFDAPSSFARLLDDDAGHWLLRPAGPFDARRRYLPDTLVLETQFDTPSGMAMLTDALVFGPGERFHQSGNEVPHALVRVIEVTRGHVTMEGSFAPRPEYGVVRPHLQWADGALVARGGAEVLVLAGPAPVVAVGDAATWLLELEHGQRAAFALQYGVAWRAPPEPWSPVEIERHLTDTIAAWESWSEQHQGHEGPWRDLVRHSGRVLRGLTFQPTGAIVAAPTTSLAEKVGGERNWDYRYAWIRDASLTMQALWVAACPDEAEQLVEWLVATAGSGHVDDIDVQVVYGVGGEHDLTERELPHLRGWRGSRPVRVGNDAWSQTQLDVFGELLDSVQRLQEQLGDLDEPSRAFLRGMADAAAGRWTEPDHGIWEIRDEPRHHVHSKLMCWVALDRAVSMADWLGADDEKAAAWAGARDEVRATILEEAWNAEVGAFTQVFGGTRLDSSALLLAITGFLPVEDPRMASTIERVTSDLSAPCGLLWRYQAHGDDLGAGLAGGEATFILCTYWLVQCYAMAGQVDRATELFEKVTAYANDVGLLAEEAEPATGELLGNFPQAFSHVGLINAAWAIEQASRDE